MRKMIEAPTAPGRAIGAKLDAKQDVTGTRQKQKKSKSAMSLFAKRNHKKIARAFGFALTLGSNAAWFKFGFLLQVRLTSRERAALAFMALKSLERGEAINVALAAIPDGAGPPIPPLLNFQDEAVFWSDFAEPEELQDYAAVCFFSMSVRAKSDFIQDLMNWVEANGV
ncbi:hypothetical protein [Marivita sp.]|uniref:hypothetical protein n=1 Tax=Marivita sp. TaxID=2003365 RepID=UPI003F71D16E